MNNQPIYVVDDDPDENEIVTMIWKDLNLKNDLKFFTAGQDLIHSLKTDPTIPFIIICDLNLPNLNGFEIREQLYNDNETRYKTVPFIFWSNTASNVQIKKAYDLSVHGMFIKGSTLSEMKLTFHRIIDYWQSSLKPIIG